jgi:bifunctional UDP-N-acetylglucosamine pyrophosphorylase / glucosamine-1-phosphate N-acetyltransferase
MPWKNTNNYFQNIPSGFIADLFANSPFPWSPLDNLKNQIQDYFITLEDRGMINGERYLIFNEDGTLKEGSYFIRQSEILESDFIDKDLKICIKAGTLVEAGATIKDHTIVENNCEIRQGAYMRGVSYIGESSVVGHTTEVKNAIFVKHVEAGHFAYIGDSIVGSYVNLGAGTKISNLEFRSLKCKQSDLFPEINMIWEGSRIKTGLTKIGAIIGDGCETGCNSVLCPLVLLEPRCWIMPNRCVLKGIYKKGSILRENGK